MTYTAKALLDKNGLIYWEKKADAADFHAGTYMSIGLNNETRFSRLFQAYKFNYYYTNVMLALTKEDNSLSIIYKIPNRFTSSGFFLYFSFRNNTFYFIYEAKSQKHRFNH